MQYFDTLDYASDLSLVIYTNDLYSANMLPPLSNHCSAIFVNTLAPLQILTTGFGIIK